MPQGVLKGGSNTLKIEEMKPTTKLSQRNMMKLLVSFYLLSNYYGICLNFLPSYQQRLHRDQRQITMSRILPLTMPARPVAGY